MEEKKMINLRDDHISISKARLLDPMQGECRAEYARLMMMNCDEGI